MKGPCLIVFAGLPGAGKTTIARHLSKELPATYLRIDTIEDGLRASALGLGNLMDGGYAVGMELAADALSLGQSVVADAVNPSFECRKGWDAVAVYAGCGILRVHVTCSDVNMHRARIDTRRLDGARRGADWSEITTRAFLTPPQDWLRIDTATQGVDAAATQILDTARRLVADV